METPIVVATIAAVASVFAALVAVLRTTLFDPERVLADRKAVRIVKQLLSHPKAPFRTFSIIRHHIGGYSDDELRRLLVRAGAVRVISRDDRELWILVKRMVERTNRGDVFFWRIDQAPQTASDDLLFPAKLREGIAR